MSDGKTTFPHLTALRAQRLLGTCAFAVAPALAAGIMAGGRLGSPGRGAVVFIGILVASWALGHGRYPLHLMPLAAFVVRVLTPVVGVALALAMFALSGSPGSVGEMVVPVIGAWIVTGFAAWFCFRFESSRQVRVAMIGSSSLAIGLAHELRIASIRGYTVVGWLDDKRPTTEPGGGGPRRLGSLDQVREVVKRHSVDLLVHSSAPSTDIDAPRHPRLELFERVAADCLDLPVRLIEAGQLYEDLLGHVPLGQSNSAWFQYLLHPRYRAGSSLSKRAFDLVVGSTMLLLLAPILAVFAAAVKLTDGGPVFYRQRRVGEGGHEFWMIKLRSMRISSEEEGAKWAEDEDDRITAVGSIMRRLHIDEMPQLWNILRGEMTIVGPRPERRELIGELELNLAYYDRRHLVKPGLAGWAQARCGYGGSAEGTGWKLCHDLFYLKHRSIYFDTLILLENVRVSLGTSVQFDVQAPQEQFIFGPSGELPG